jgi:hypothetical protein
VQALELALIYSGQALSASAEFKAGHLELWDKPAMDIHDLALPLPLHSLQGTLENLRAYLRRLKTRGRANAEWRRGILIVMREIAQDLAGTAARRL